MNDDFLVLHEIERFSVAAAEGEVPRARLVVGGVPTATVLGGAILEAQYETGAGVLLVLTDDCPYEERLHLYLLDDRLNSRDHLELGSPYTPGLFRRLDDGCPTHLTFEFDSDRPYTLLVRRRPRRLLWASVSGLRRRTAWTQLKYLEVRAANVEP